MSDHRESVAVIIPAAGSGQRLGGRVPKALRMLGGKPLWVHALQALASHPAVVQVILAVPAAEVAAVAGSLPQVDAAVDVVPGGASRQASVAAGLDRADPSCGIILVHDAARPLVPLPVVDRVIEAVAAGAAAVVPGLPLVDTVKRVDEAGFVVDTLPRHLLRAVQTPQGFRRTVLIAAHRAADDGRPATDDAALVEQAGYPVLVVEGDPAAMKITGPADLERAEQQLSRWQRR